MRRADIARHARGTSLILLALLGGCADPASLDRRDPDLDETSRRRLYERAGSVFAAGHLLKPAGTPVDSTVHALAPLLVHEAGDAEEDEPVDAPGVVSRDGWGRTIVSAEASAVYYSRSVVAIDDREHTQWTYLWWYPGSPEAREPDVQGIRLTLGADGFPAIYEVMSDTSGAQPLFVTTTLEEQASAEYGPPLPGRQFSVEASVEETPGVIVPAVLEPGPVPLGPFAYVTRGSRDVSALICRCMPSQVDRIPVSSEYRLEPLAGVDLSSLPLPARLLDPNAISLAGRIRLPTTPI